MTWKPLSYDREENTVTLPLFNLIAIVVIVLYLGTWLSFHSFETRVINEANTFLVENCDNYDGVVLSDGERYIGSDGKVNGSIIPLDERPISSHNFSEVSVSSP